MLKKNKIQINENIENAQNKQPKKNSKMKFDLWRIIIRNEYEIVKMMITKISILHKLVPMKHCH
jgi:hypothetical protein